MSPKEEELEKRKKLLGDYVIASRKELDAKLKAINEVSESFGNFLGALHQLGQNNEKEMLEYRSFYQKYFLDELNKKGDYRLQLEFVFQQIKDLSLKIAETKAHRHERYQKIYEDTLNDIVRPFKIELLEMVRLENEVGKLRKVETPPMVNEVKQTEKDIPIKDIIEENKNVPAPENTEFVIMSEVPKELEQSKIHEQINIPITLTDKPLKTKSGKLLNNPKHIGEGRKFSWKDKLIPDLIGDFLLENHCIFDYQLKVVQEFFRVSKSDRKIVFDGNANQLTTMLYDLRSEKYMSIFNDSLGRLIESVFVKKENTTQALITQKSLVSDFKPGNNSRRIKAGSPYYLDILTYLSENLKTPE